MTLDETWAECLSMWKWIVEQIENGTNLYRIALKIAWLKKHEYDYKKLEHKCFFCQYNKDVKKPTVVRCSNCPAVLVDNEFYCMNSEYHHWEHPRKFYDKLLELDKQRKAITL